VERSLPWRNRREAQLRGGEGEGEKGSTNSFNIPDDDILVIACSGEVTRVMKPLYVIESFCMLAIQDRDPLEGPRIEDGAGLVGSCERNQKEGESGSIHEEAMRSRLGEYLRAVTERLW
jgi:hypothetical protein